MPGLSLSHHQNRSETVWFPKLNYQGLRFGFYHKVLVITIVFFQDQAKAFNRLLSANK